MPAVARAAAVAVAILSKATLGVATVALVAAVVADITRLMQPSLVSIAPAVG